MPLEKNGAGFVDVAERFATGSWPRFKDPLAALCSKLPAGR
jgi:hypothetical protein